MSELIPNAARHEDVRWKLLATVSAFALAAAVGTPRAEADDADRPTVWIELGGQLEALRNTQDTFTAPFLNGAPTPTPFPFNHRYFGMTPTVISQPEQAFDYSQPLDAQHPPEQSFGGEAKITFMPDGSDWLFSASLRYGRSNGTGHAHQTTGDRIHTATRMDFHATNISTPNIVRFSDADARYNESHAVLDFQVGRDVGLGIFGRHSTSVINAGVRFAQFTSKSSTTVKADPFIQAYGYKKYGFGGGLPKYYLGTRFHTYAMTAHSQRSFHGIGPSLSWNGSTPFIGNPDTAEFTFDWGVNAALLFGRQKARTDHKTDAYDRHHTPNYIYDARITQYNHDGGVKVRSRSVVVPNLGGFAGLSLKFPNAKVSLGYRADFFFGAMDAGIDARRTETISFHGPFASLSIGLGGG
jgi:hypothetical protein